MRIHLIRTPEYEYEEYLKVCELLQSYPGPMEFVARERNSDELDFVHITDNSLLPPLPYKFKKNSFYPWPSEYDQPVSWGEIFSFCNSYRKWKEIPQNDFVILLTNRRNEYNWFSSFDQQNNAFVHTADWENFVTDVSPKYPIAYEIVANIVRSLMNLDLENIPNQFIHEPFKACMNDFCKNKKEIIIKLSNSRICPDCLSRINSLDVSNEMMTQVQAIFKGIQSEFDFKVETKPIAPSKISISDKGEILLDDYEIVLNMPELWKTLYIFFLRHPEGVLAANIDDFAAELREIYSVCRPTARVDMVNTSIANLVYHDRAHFNQTKSKINKMIKDLLKEPRCNYYLIEGVRNNPYKISIPRNLVDIRF
jgi:hypothetical protein